MRPPSQFWFVPHYGRWGLEQPVASLEELLPLPRMWNWAFWRVSERVEFGERELGPELEIPAELSKG